MTRVTRHIRIALAGVLAFLAAVVFTLALPVRGNTVFAAELDPYTDAFAATTADDLVIENGVLTGFSETYLASNETDVALTVPDTVTSIAEEAFSGRCEIKAVLLNGTVTIGADAFKDCNGIVEVRDSGNNFSGDPGVSSDGQTAGGLLDYALSFVQSNTTNLALTESGLMFCTGNRTAADTNGKKFLVGYYGSLDLVQLPASEGAFEIYQYAFWKNEKIKTIRATSSVNVTKIGRFAFSECPNLQEVVFENITDIGYGAFLKCAALETAEFPKAVTLADFAFSECANLTGGLINLEEGTLTIPFSVTSIGRNAFYGCSAFRYLSFEKFDTEGGEPLTVGQSAFQGCSRLTVAELPKRLDTLGLYAFRESGATAIYLHSDVTYVAPAAIADVNYFPATALIIYDDYTAYTAAKATAALESHVSRMTYGVKVEFISLLTDGRTRTELSKPSLAGFDYLYEQGANKAWTLVRDEQASRLIPTQAGYFESVWFEDRDCTQKLDQGDKDHLYRFVTAALQKGTEEDIGSTISYFALYREKPTLANIEYTYDEEKSYGDQEKYIELLRLYNEEGFDERDVSDWKVTVSRGENAIANAGTYTLQINLTGEYGRWASPVDVTVTIARKTVRIKDFIEWQGANSLALLSDKLIYVYRNGENKELYYGNQLSPAQIPEGYEYYAATTGSFIASHNATIQVELKASRLTVTENSRVYTYGTVDPANLFNGSTVPFDGNRFTASETNSSGRLLANSVVNATRNYLFNNAGDIPTMSSAEEGLTITISADGTQALISKVWYVVAYSNQVYKKGTGEPFAMSSWTYHTSVAVGIPEPEVQNGADWSFKLERDGVTIIEGVEDTSKYSYYVNSSMPAGAYRLTLTIQNSEEADSYYFGYTAAYDFEVQRARFEDAWKDAETKLIDVTYRYKQANGRAVIQLHRRGEDNLDLAVWKVSSLNPTRTGFWAETKQDVYYDEAFELAYHLPNMTNSRYYTYEELKGLSSQYSPQDEGDYTVYYQLSAKNYVPLVTETDDESKEAHKFVVTIYKVIELPTVAPMAYTGENIYPVLDADAAYGVSYTDTDYINVGTHTVTLTSNNPKHYRWAAFESEADHANMPLSFEIVRSNNEMTVSLSLAQWSLGGYAAAVNVPSWGTRFFDKEDAGFYTYTLTSKKDKKVYTYGDQTMGFDKAPVGEYTFTAYAKGYSKGQTDTEKYNWNAFSVEEPFVVQKGVNRWEVTPNVMQWKYGAYDKTLNLVLARPVFDEASNPVTFSVSSDAKGEKPVKGLESFTAANGVVPDAVAKIFEGFTVGTYYLWSNVAPTDSYEALNPDAFEFQVTEGTNYWDDAPVLDTWIVGNYDETVNTLNAKPHFGDKVNVVITVAGDQENVVFDSLKGINLLKKAKVGVYELTASVEGTKDYSGITTSFTFQIFEKEGLPWWATLLIVIAVVAVIALVFFILHQKGVLQMLTGKVVLNMRARATIDATIAAVRANKVAEDAKKAQQRARMKELAEARKRKLEEAKNMTLEEQAAALDERAQEAAEKAEKLGVRADRMQKRADRMKKRAANRATEQENASAVEPENGSESDEN